MSEYEYPVSCLWCNMGLKIWKLRRQWVHFIKTMDHRTGQSGRKIHVCSIRNLRSTIKPSS